MSAWPRLYFEMVAEERRSSWLAIDLELATWTEGLAVHRYFPDSPIGATGVILPYYLGREDAKGLRYADRTGHCPHRL